MGHFLDRVWDLLLSWELLRAQLFSSQGANGRFREVHTVPQGHSKRGTVVEIQSRLHEFPPSHVLMLSTRNDDSLWAEGGGDRGWVCRRDNPAVAEGPKGPGRAGCGCGGDCHRPVALRAKIAQGEVGSFRMNKVCTGLVSDGSR